VLAYQLAGQPASQQVLDDANRLATSSEIFAQTAKQLPQLINDQRQAAIQQILDGLTAQGDKSRELLTDARSTLYAAGDAATNINAAIQSLTAFVQYVSPTNTSPASAATNSPPFNVLDYGTAATQIGAAANNLNALLASVNQSTPQLEKLSQQTKADADEVIRHAFMYGLMLVLILLAGSVLAALAYRILANKLVKNGRKPDAP
jgi:methyl-accepting chemotaxis protein